LGLIGLISQLLPGKKDVNIFLVVGGSITIWGFHLVI